MSVSKARRAELEAELLKTMDRLDELRVEQKEAQAAARKELALTAQKIRDLRDILSGREGDQTSIPGTEVGLVKPRPAAPAKSAPASPARPACPDGCGRPSHQGDCKPKKKRFDKGAAADLPRLTADDVKDELCLDCGIAAGKPSPGCEGCDHPDEPKGKKGRPKGAPQDDCAKCGAPSYALVDGQPTCHPCYEKVAKGSAA